MRLRRGLSLPGATVRLRSFTPAGVEVGGAGPNALGAWLWLEAAGRLAPAAAGGLRQEIAGQLLPVQVFREAGQPAAVWMDQPPPRSGAVASDRAGPAACLGLGERDLAADEDAQVVDQAVPDPAQLKSALRHVGAEGCYLDSRDPVDASGAAAYARFSNPTVGIAEDPRPEPPPGRWPPGLSPRAGSPASPRSSSSRVTHWGGRAGLPCRFRGSAFASVVPDWS
jgi:trans-2,3-dihydro-3-hydroxyanthranilate isomerase